MRKTACLALGALMVSGQAYALEPGQCLSVFDMNTAMRAEAQRSIISGNRSTLRNDSKTESGISAQRWANLYTSNADGSLGYNIEANTELGVPAQKMCVGLKYTNIRLFDAKLPGVQNNVRRSPDFAKSLQDNEAMGTRVMMQADAIATGPDGKVKIGNGITLFGNIKIKGGYLVVNYRDGKSADMFHMTDTAYTPEGLARLKALAAAPN